MRVTHANNIENGHPINRNASRHAIQTSLAGLRNHVIKQQWLVRVFK
jgi:hypothetical protein